VGKGSTRGAIQRFAPFRLKGLKHATSYRTLSPSLLQSASYELRSRKAVRTTWQVCDDVACFTFPLTQFVRDLLIYSALFATAIRISSLVQNRNCRVRQSYPPVHVIPRTVSARFRGYWDSGRERKRSKPGTDLKTRGTKDPARSQC
jgi:hypothetical protein